MLLARHVLHKEMKMKKQKNKFILNVVVSAILASGWSPAHAVMMVEDVAGWGFITAAGATVSAAVVALGVTLTTWAEMRLLPGLSGAQTALGETILATSTIQAEQAIANNKSRDLAILERRSMDFDPCKVSAAGSVGFTVNAAALANKFARGSGGSPRTNGGPVASGSSGQLKRLLEIADGTVPTPPPDQAAPMAANAGCSQFTAAGGVRAKACDNAGFQPALAGKYANADISAHTLFDGPQKDAETASRRLTIDMTKNGPEEMAVRAFVRHLDVPIKLRSLKAGELGTPAGQKFIGINDTFDARMSMAMYPVWRNIGLMTQPTDPKKSIEQLKAMSAGDKQILDYLDANVPNWSRTGASSDELMNVDVARRYADLMWQAKTTDSSADWVAREHLRVAAQTNVLLLRLNEESRINGLLLGSLLASANRVELLPELKAAHAAAAR